MLYRRRVGLFNLLHGSSTELYFFFVRRWDETSSVNLNVLILPLKAYKAYWKRNSFLCYCRKRTNDKKFDWFDTWYIWVARILELNRYRTFMSSIAIRRRLQSKKPVSQQSWSGSQPWSLVLDCCDVCVRQGSPVFAPLVNNAETALVFSASRGSPQTVCRFSTKDLTKHSDFVVIIQMSKSSRQLRQQCQVSRDGAARLCSQVVRNSGYLTLSPFRLTAN